ncbi:hypothetical protein EDB86DRAFT_3065557 [Lactarius hatsudake]|nr:hypothetical protein EDB86DRAFT_3065557 [Lactarius hatsudake]
MRGVLSSRSIWRAPTHHAQRRHLFKLPDLTFVPFPPQTYHEQKVLPYTRQQLYAVVADVGSYASFVPFCTRSRMEAELTVAFLAFTEHYTSRVTWLAWTWTGPSPRRCALRARVQTTPGPTVLSLDLAFEFANPLHGAVSGAFFGKVSTLMVKAFEERCVKVYGPG